MLNSCLTGWIDSILSSGSWACICKRLWSPGIDAASHVAWRASTTYRVVVPVRQLGIDFWASERVYKYVLWPQVECWKSFLSNLIDWLKDHDVTRRCCLPCPPSPAASGSRNFQDSRLSSASLQVIPYCYFLSVLEFLNTLWGLGTEKAYGCRSGPTGYIGTDSLEPFLRLL